MKLSIVIPAYNEEKYISVPLKSLSEQSFTDFEVIVCLNNCTDNTRGVVEDIKAKTNLDIKIVEETQKGVSFARNTGFAYAQADIIASADADTYYPKDWTEKIINNFENNNILGVYGSVHMKSDKWYMRFSARYLFTIFLKISHFFGNYNINGMNFAVRKEAFNKIGGFNTDWKSAEDIYIGLKLKEIGSVKFDRKMIVYTNDRRFKNDSTSSLIYHIKNYINVFLKKKEPLDFSDIR